MLAVGCRPRAARRPPARAGSHGVPRRLPDQLGEILAVLGFTQLHGDLDAAVRQDLFPSVTLAVLVELGYILDRAHPEQVVRAPEAKETRQALDLRQVPPFVTEDGHRPRQLAAGCVRDGIHGGIELLEQDRRDRVVGGTLVHHMEEQRGLLAQDSPRLDIVARGHARNRRRSVNPQVDLERGDDAPQLVASARDELRGTRAGRMPLRQGAEQAFQRLARVLAGPLRPHAYDVVDRREVPATPRAAPIQHGQKDRRRKQRPRGFRPVARLRIGFPRDERTGDGVRGLLRPRQVSPAREPVYHLQGIERVAPLGMLGI